MAISAICETPGVQKYDLADLGTALGILRGPDCNSGEGRRATYQFQSCNGHSHRRNPCFRVVGCVRVEQTADHNDFRKDMALLNTFRIGHRALMAVLLSCAAIGRGIVSRP